MIERQLMLDLGQGFMPKPLQKPHPPIVLHGGRAVLKGRDGSRGARLGPDLGELPDAELGEEHWPKYVEGCERVGRTADHGELARREERVRVRGRGDREGLRQRSERALSLLLQPALHQAEARQPAGRLQDAADQPDEEVTIDAITDKLIFWGSPNRVADQILAFREEVGDFGTLLLAGKDWKRPRTRPPQHDPARREGDAAGERRDRQEQAGSGIAVTSPGAEEAA